MLNSPILYQTYLKVFTPDECEEIGSIAKAKGDNQRGMTGFQTKNPAKEETFSGIPNADIRRSDLWFFEEPWVFERLQQIFVTANQECSWNLHIDQFEACQYTEYHGHEKGHYDWHYDAHPWPYGDDTLFPGKLRKLSATVLMNEPSEYTGGGFELDGGMEHNERKTEIVKLAGIGDMVIFSSVIPHRVLPVTEGTRKSMVVWALGPTYK